MYTRQAPEIFDATVLAMRRARAAADIGAHDFLFQRAVADLVDRLAVVRRTFTDVACVGWTADALAARVQSAMAAANVVCIGDDHGALPLTPESVDLVLSALTLQFVDDLPGALAQMRRALRPDGLMLAVLVGGETLKELREAWLVAEEATLGGASPRVAPFADVRDCGGLLQRAGFALPVADSDVVTVRYDTPLHLMQDIKGMGAGNVLAERSRRPVSRRLLQRAAEIYAERFSDADGRVRATFEIITLTGWAPHESQQKPLRPGSAKTRLADALGVPEQPAGDKPPRSPSAT